MKNRKILKKILESKEETELLYKITKIIAETDSIGEGYSYCSEYSKKYFEQEISEIINNTLLYDGYVFNVALPIYILLKK